ncbi:MAG: hypothetical protein AB7K09_24330 [Planctomycetota bacterium]
MRSVNFTTFFASLLVASAFAAGATFAVVTMFLPASPASNAPRVADSRTMSSAESEALARIEKRLAGLEGAPELDPNGVGGEWNAVGVATVLERLRHLEDRLTVIEQRGERDVVARDGDTVAPGGPGSGAAQATPGLPNNFDEMIDRRIQWLKEEEMRKAKEAQEKAMIENLERTREWYGKVYDKAIEVMNTELGMSAAQVDSMRDLLKWRGDELLKNSDPRVAQEDRKPWNEVNNEFTKRVSGLLSPQQLQVYKEKNLGDFNAIQRQLWQQDQGNARSSDSGGAVGQQQALGGAVRLGGRVER